MSNDKKLFPNEVDLARKMLIVLDIFKIAKESPESFTKHFGIGVFLPIEHITLTVADIIKCYATFLGGDQITEEQVEFILRMAMNRTLIQGQTSPQNGREVISYCSPTIFKRGSM